LVCIVLMSQIDRSGSLILFATVVVALINWLWVRRRPAPVSAEL
jgi:hypothetical protein